MICVSPFPDAPACSERKIWSVIVELHLGRGAAPAALLTAALVQQEWLMFRGALFICSMA